MNRTIKFRGLTKYGNWVYGCLLYWAGEYQIWETEKDGQTHNYSVIPKTVGQYTGIKDKNGKEIWEGDYVRGISEGTKYLVEFESGGFTTNIGLIGLIECEVIGNIHDNN